MMTQKRLMCVVAFLFFLIFSPTIALAQLPTCAQLTSLPPLAGNPAVFSASATELTTGGRAYCRVDVTWRDPSMVGSAAGYAPGSPPTVDTFQTIRLAVSLPLNTNTGDAAWGGRLIMTAGGGAQGSVPGITSMILMNPAAMGAGSDSGHGDVNSGSGDSWGVINGVSLNYGKIEDWAGGRSNGITVKLAKQIAQTYYGTPVARTYWNGCSGGGHMGWAQMLYYPEEYDGAVIGAPANNWQTFRLADSWDELVKKKVVQLGSPAITQVQLNAANADSKAACDAADGVIDGIVADPRACTWSATNNICGVPGAPATPELGCLNEIQAAGIDQMWDGPRNRYGLRIWPSYERGINVGVSTTTQSSTAQVMRYNHYDNNFDRANLYLDQESIDLAATAGVDVTNAITYEDEATLGSNRTADFIDDNDPTELGAAHAKGIKIIVYHGTQDSAIQFNNAIDQYTRTAAHFSNGTPDFNNLWDWYRLFLVPGAGHCPQVPQALPSLIDWVENGEAPDYLVQTTLVRKLCPFPQWGMYNGSGSTTDANNFTCGGNLQTKETICRGLRTVYKHENEDALQAYGRYNPASCNEHSKVPINKPKGKPVVSLEFNGYDRYDKKEVTMEDIP